VPLGRQRDRTPDEPERRGQSANLGRRESSLRWTLQASPMNAMLLHLGAAVVDSRRSLDETPTRETRNLLRSVLLFTVHSIKEAHTRLPTRPSNTLSYQSTHLGPPPDAHRCLTSILTRQRPTAAPSVQPVNFTSRPPLPDGQLSSPAWAAIGAACPQPLSNLAARRGQRLERAQEARCRRRLRVARAEPVTRPAAWRGSLGRTRARRRGFAGLAGWAALSAPGIWLVCIVS
jgi:hypothetical protein